uniref:Concentrative nucleoside transporter C-terminal domain-containing protein n=1 Tax=Chromera velia CCMP2878 TaxID=1169474 RepID=A0A0G4IE63_9ALVE|eukprot:Cvel_13626.t1-p1 / transcript=Cvel_13626.t1 / gene=Cvel_13626 / organism=Chromera_velia_CCMP2878 / gene_product=Solute carrier family 28 member 3, putative / transcript_product=Solute carrier family 28 member 3, putative / location=Cvel_scaffold939:9239-13177(-) / protein_length=765 / sequence_SO=supercontig / SO=protein_coding / is_pseudo=false
MQAGSKDSEKRSRRLNLTLRIVFLVLFVAYFVTALVLDVNRALPLVYVTAAIVGYFALRYSIPVLARAVKKSLVRSGKCSAGCSRRSACTRVNPQTVVQTMLLLFMVAFVVARSVGDLKCLISGAGILVFIGIAYALSPARRQIVWQPLVWGVFLQFLLGLLILQTEAGLKVFEFIGEKFNAFIGFADSGIDFLFGKSEMSIAFRVLPLVVYFSAAVGVLRYFGAIQPAIRGAAWVMSFTMQTTGPESLIAAANIFLGQTEAPLLISPLIPRLSSSELFALMTSGMASIAGTVLGVYIAMGISPSGLLAASVMTAPAALAMSKLFLPHGTSLALSHAKEAGEEQEGEEGGEVGGALDEERGQRGERNGDETDGALEESGMAFPGPSPGSSVPTRSPSMCPPPPLQGTGGIVGLQRESRDEGEGTREDEAAGLCGRAMTEREESALGGPGGQASSSSFTSTGSIQQEKERERELLGSCRQAQRTAGRGGGGAMSEQGEVAAGEGDLEEGGLPSRGRGARGRNLFGMETRIWSAGAVVDPRNWPRNGKKVEGGVGAEGEETVKSKDQKKNGGNEKEEENPDAVDVEELMKSPDSSLVEALANGTAAAIILTLNIGAQLLVFISAVAFVNAVLSWFGFFVGLESLSLEKICSYVLSPLAFLMGVPWQNGECLIAGELLGMKIFLNEFVAYSRMVTPEVQEALGERAKVILTFAMCGFSNVGSIGVMVGGLGTLAEARKSEVASLAWYAFAASNLACFLTASTAGVFVS